jgi:hypothetical protein
LVDLLVQGLVGALGFAIIASAIRQKNVRQKNRGIIFLSHIFLSGWSYVVETMIEALNAIRHISYGIWPDR